MSQITPNIRPLSDRIVVEPKEKESKTAGGIVLPDSVDKNQQSTDGKVVAIGNGKFVDGKLHPLQVKIGDKVVFGKYAGTNVKFGEKDYLIMREEDVMGIID